MLLDLTEIGKAFLILFAVIDIVGGIPLILRVRQKAGKIYPARAVLVSLGIMITFLFVGETILSVLGIDVRSFAVAGALILFFIALEMILGVRLFKEDLSAPGLTDASADNKVHRQISALVQKESSITVHLVKEWWGKCAHVARIIYLADLNNMVERLSTRIHDLECTGYPRVIEQLDIHICRSIWICSTSNK